MKKILSILLTAIIVVSGIMATTTKVIAASMESESGAKKLTQVARTILYEKTDFSSLTMASFLPTGANGNYFTGDTELENTSPASGVLQTKTILDEWGQKYQVKYAKNVLISGVKSIKNQRYDCAFIITSGGEDKTIGTVDDVISFVTKKYTVVSASLYNCSPKIKYTSELQRVLQVGYQVWYNGQTVYDKNFGVTPGATGVRFDRIETQPCYGGNDFSVKIAWQQVFQVNQDYAGWGFTWDVGTQNHNIIPVNNSSVINLSGYTDVNENVSTEHGTWKTVKVYVTEFF